MNTTKELTSSLEIVAIDMRHLTSDQKELHQMILDNIKSALKVYVNSLAILSEEIKGYNLLAVILVHQKLQVLLQPKRFDLHAIHKAIDAIKVEQGETSTTTEVDLLRHVSKLMEKASQKMKVVGKLVWLSTKCPSQSSDVISSLEKLKQQQVLVDFVNINSLEICPDERQFTEVSIPLANWAVALREFPNCRLHRIGTDVPSFERYFKERIEEGCLQEDIAFTLQGFSSSSWQLKARPRMLSSLMIELASLCSCHHASVGSKTDNMASNGKKTCPILKSALDEEDIAQGVQVGKTMLPLAAKPNSQATMTIQHICPLNSLSEDLLHGMSFTVTALENSEQLEAIVNILSNEESFLLATSSYNFVQQRADVLRSNFALIPDRYSGTLLMKALVPQEQLLPQSLPAISDSIDPMLLEQVGAELKKIPRGDLDVLGLESSMHEIINEAVKMAPLATQKPSMVISPQAVTVPVLPSSQQASSKKPAKQPAANSRAPPLPKEPKKKVAGNKKAPQFENVMLNFDDIPEP